MRILAMGDPLWGDAAHLMLYKSAHHHEVRTAGPDGSFDYLFEPRETTTEFLARISLEWAPDVLYCGFPEMYPPPRAVENCPIPTIAAISDWNLHGPQMFHNLCRFDVVLSDLQATKRLKLHGITPQHLFPMYSHRTYVHRPIERPRDTDVLFLGNLNHAIHRARGEMLEHVAKNSGGLRVQIDAGLPPEDYALRLNESKIALNYGVRGEMNLRCFEAPACGALLFIEEDNLETFDWLEPGTQCISYNLDNVMDRIRYFIEHKDDREEVALAGQKRVLELAAEKRLDTFFNWMKRVQPGARAFHALEPRRRALADALFYGSSMNSTQRAYAKEELAVLRDRHPHDGEILLACGCSAFDHAVSIGHAIAQRDARRDLIRESINAFDAAQRALPGEVVPLMNLASLARQAGAAASEERYLTRALEMAGTAHGEYLIGRLNDPYYAEWRLALALGEASSTFLEAAAHTRLAELCLETKDPASALIHATTSQALAPHIVLNYTLAGRAARARGDLDLAKHFLARGLPLTTFDAAHRQLLIEVLRGLGQDAEAHDLAAESLGIFSVCPPLAAYVPLFEALQSN